MHEPTRFKKPAPNRKPLSPYLRSYEQSPPPPLPPPPLTSFTLCRALHGWPCRISAAGYPKGKHQLLPPVAPRAALPLHFWDILATVKDDSVAVAYGCLPYDLPCVAFSSGVLVSCLRWLCQQLFQQQATTTTHSGRRVLAGGLLLSGDDVCHGWGIRDILVCPACSSPRQHLTCVLIALQGIVSSTQ